ncbi:MAG TPA: hypothetical protein VE888_18620 [Streptosporangiaceae bacterium]|nr:hypothetical protein [Streptosporangiaceae bacterium]
MVGREALRRVTDLGVEVVPGGTAAAVTVAMPQGALSFAASDPRVDELHELQFSRAQAFTLLRQHSQDTNQRVRIIAARLVQGRLSTAQITAR